ncbi:MAG: hypothetical protein ACYDCP_06270 [Thermoplasmataceae archaeon]
MAEYLSERNKHCRYFRWHVIAHWLRDEYYGKPEVPVHNAGGEIGELPGYAMISSPAMYPQSVAIAIETYLFP